MKNKFFYYVGILAGAIFIFIGAFFIGKSGSRKSYLYADDAKFGADYYTCQYEATKYAANNLAMIGNRIDGWINNFYIGFGSGSIAFGLVVIAYFGSKLADFNNKSSEHIIVKENSIKKTEVELPEL